VRVAWSAFNSCSAQVWIRHNHIYIRTKLRQIFSNHSFDAFYDVPILYYFYHIVFALHSLLPEIAEQHSHMASPIPIVALAWCGHVALCFIVWSP
jgi:ABC-type protease/lipase transport system fused ATPase/permease subunit